MTPSEADRLLVQLIGAAEIGAGFVSLLELIANACPGLNLCKHASVVSQQSRDKRGGLPQASRGVGLEPVGTGTKWFRQALPSETPLKASGWWPSSRRPIDHGRKARPSRKLYCKEA
jgi:hypothetical protein